MSPSEPPEPPEPAESAEPAARATPGVPPSLALSFPATYDRLRAIAQRFLSAERGDHSLQATALVHEAFLRLAEGRVEALSDEALVSLAAAQMRHVLVDHARRRNALKRNAGERPIRLDTTALGVEAPASHTVDLVVVDDLLRRLETLAPRQAKLVELHIFGDVPIDRAADLLGVSERTAFNDWRMARAWLLAALRG